MKRYRTFAEYASDQLKNSNETLPVPIVTSRKSNSSIPLAIIIGVQVLFLRLILAIVLSRLLR